jgi:predicted nucleic acid-binding protein
MNGKCFLDTNILIYAIEGQPEGKAKIAERLIEEAIGTKSGVISLQVVQETLNALIRKTRIALSYEKSSLLLRDVLTPLCEVFPSLELLQRGLDLHDRYNYSFYDSLVIAAALEAKCDVLYSEDLQHGQKIGTLIIENPFAGLS